MSEDVVALVERLEARANRMTELGSPRGELLTEAASTIRALVAERDHNWNEYLAERAARMEANARENTERQIAESVELRVREQEHYIEEQRQRISDADAVIQRLNSGAELQAIMVAHNDTLAKLREAVELMWTLYHAACGPTGFAAAVRATSGVPYPWPALDEADDLARAFLAAQEEGTSE